jgi:hypothetical protein
VAIERRLVQAIREYICCSDAPKTAAWSNSSLSTIGATRHSVMAFHWSIAFRTHLGMFGRARRRGLKETRRAFMASNSGRFFSVAQTPLLSRTARLS